MKRMTKADSPLARGFRDGIPIFLGYLAVSFSFGLLARKTGLSIGQSALMSALNLTSAGQFSALEIIAEAGSLLEMAVCQLIINLRYCLMSCALSQRLDPRATLLQRCAVAFGNTDEIFALNCAYSGMVPPAYAYGQILAALPGWVLGTVLGAAAGSILPPLLLNALSVMLYGMFIAIVMPPARENKAVRFAVLAAAGLSLLFSLAPILKTIGSGMRVILLTVLISALAAWRFPVKEDAA